MSGLREKWRGKLVLLFLTAALGGCVAPPASPSPSPAADRPAGTDPAASPSVASKSLPADAVPDASPDIVAPLPETLLGKDRAEIVNILGEPTFRRHDVPALLMRYRDKRCILDLFLYLPAGANGTGSPAVEHVEARGLDGGKIATRGCIESVMKSRAAGSSG